MKYKLNTAEGASLAINHLYLCSLVLAVFMVCHVVHADTWVYDWSARVDRDGRSAGLYTNTPCPITETSSVYTYKSDEFPNGKTYHLGTILFVDGARVDNTGDGLTLATAKKTINAALLTAGNGNKTILVRGAHDGFNGVYKETVSFNGVSGVDDTHRFMLVGYGQERPVLDGGGGTSSIIRRGHASPAYITIQRLKLENTQASGVRLGWDADTDKRDQYFNCIDIWFYTCGNNPSYATDGNCYYLNTDNGFISHCLFERSEGHGVKIGDGSSNCILEWSVVRENGWWPGKAAFLSRTVAIDLPSDRDTQINDIVRYCIASGNVSHGLQLRRVRGFYVHHNEISDFGHGPGMAGAMAGVEPHGVTIIATSWGRFEHNVVHTPSPANTNGILLQVGTVVTNSEIHVRDNLFYDAATRGPALLLDLYHAAHTFIVSNTFVQSNGTYVIGIRAGQAWTNEIVHNLIWQRGLGSCGEMIYHSIAPVHRDNVLFFPAGTGAEWGEVGDTVTDPKLSDIPTGTFSYKFIQASSSVTGLQAPVISPPEKLRVISR